MRIFTLLLFLFTTNITFAQKNTAAFLQQYKFRTPNFRSALVSGNANGGFGTSEGLGNAYNFSFNPKFEAVKIISTDKILASYSYQASAGFYHNKASFATGVQLNTNLNYSLSQSASKRNYKQSNYFQTGFSTVLKQSFAKNTNNYMGQDNSGFGSVAYIVGFGKGRIENVTDAQMAYNILNDLKKNNLLTADFSDEDVNGLAKTITQINNTRLFDFRRKHIFELKQIDSFLNTKGLIKEKNIDYFTTVNDNWFYAFNEFRRHGKEKFITLTPLLGLNNTKTIFNIIPVDSLSKSFSKFALLTLSVGIEKAKALSIKKQFNKGLSLNTIYGYSMNKYTNNTAINNSNGSNILSSLIGYLQWGYYPTTRTNINTAISNNFIWDYEGAQFNNNTFLSLAGNYFINYNTRIFLNLYSNLNVAKNSNADFNTAVSASFAFGFQHYLR